MIFKNNLCLAILLLVIVILFSFFSEYRSNTFFKTLEGYDGISGEDDPAPSCGSQSISPACYSTVLSDASIYGSDSTYWSSDDYIKKTEIVPPVCPACPSVFSDHTHGNVSDTSDSDVSSDASGSSSSVGIISNSGNTSTSSSSSSNTNVYNETINQNYTNNSRHNRNSNNNTNQTNQTNQTIQNANSFNTNQGNGATTNDSDSTNTNDSTSMYSYDLSSNSSLNNTSSGASNINSMFNSTPFSTQSNGQPSSQDYESQIQNLQSQLLQLKQQNDGGMSTTQYPPCPPCDRCPEPIVSCEKKVNYQSPNIGPYLPVPILNDFSSFGEAQ
jgi:hypothetical protein